MITSLDCSACQFMGTNVPFDLIPTVLNLAHNDTLKHVSETGAIAAPQISEDFGHPMKSFYCRLRGNRLVDQSLKHLRHIKIFKGMRSELPTVGSQIRQLTFNHTQATNICVHYSWPDLDSFASPRAFSLCARCFVLTGLC